jgi:hypothetical protein
MNTFYNQGGVWQCHVSDDTNSRSCILPSIISQGARLILAPLLRTNLSCILVFLQQ